MPILRATTSFATSDRTIRTGDLVDSTDPVVKGRESLFELVEVAAARTVEQATAAPGEKRARKARA